MAPQSVFITPKNSPKPRDDKIAYTLSRKRGGEQLNVKVGEVVGKLEGDRSKVRFVQTNMAHLLLAAQAERANADFTILSGGGGVRDSIESGNITYKDVLKVQPFSNALVYIDFKGDEIEPYLSASACMKVDSGAYAQFYNVSLTVDQNCKVSDVKIAGKPLDKTKTYRMVTLNFNAIGGDSYPKIDTYPAYVNTGFVNAEVLKGYIEAHSSLNAADFKPKGEIIYKK